jgi:hypothetical protein
MRNRIVRLATAVMLGLASQAGVGAQADKAATAIAAARAALGGETRIAGVKTFIANGRTRQVRGENLVPIEFDIQVELPDRYSRRDEFPAQDGRTAPRAASRGDRLIQIPRAPAPPPRAGAPPPDPAQLEAATRARVNAGEAGFWRV